MRTWISATLLFLSSPALASAQTVTLAIDDGPLAAPPAEVARAAAEPFAAPPAAPAPSRAPVGVPVAAPAEPIRTEVWGGFGIWTEAMDLRSFDLEMRDPEVRALQGLRLTEGWAGNAPLGQHVVGGAVIGAGMRAAGVLRGPEVRVYLGGGSVGDGPWADAPGRDGLALQVQSSFVFRLETAVGVQAELGPLVPYLLARAGIGGAWIDMGVRDARIGELGTETVSAPLLQLGLEAGVGLRPDDGVEVGFAFRGSFLGTTSYGGVVSVTFGGE